ncbi:ABC transporter ATP-binding protein [Desulfobacca acetoxidans]
MLLEAVGLAKAFRMGFSRNRVRQVLRGINLCLERGETLGIVGDSGAGKSTLCLILAGLSNPDRGCLMLGGTNVRGMRGSQRMRFHRRVQILFQHPETVFDPLRTLRYSLIEPLRTHGLPVSEEIIALQLLRVGLDTAVLSRRPAQLSGGELQRLAIARALVLQPEVIILDEPTSMLDAITQARIMRLLKDIREANDISYLFVSHDLPLVRLFSDRVCLLQEGTLESFELR